MSYINKHLSKDEKVVYTAKPHWIIFLRAALWLILTLVIVFLGAVYNLGNVRIIAKLPPLYLIIALITLIATLIAALPAYIKYATTEFVITNKRVLFKQGLFRHSTCEIILSRIESISIYQGVLARLLNYGSLIISGTGGTRDPFMYLPNPSRLRNLLQEQIELSEKG